MDMNQEWMAQELGAWRDESQDYLERAYLSAALALIEEQFQRIEQSQDELDGRLWSPKGW